MLRVIVSIASGLFTGFLVGILGLMIRMNLYPLPDWLERGNEVQYGYYYNNLPDWFFVINIISYTLGCFFAALVASLTSEKARYQAGLIAGCICVGIVVYMVFKVNNPPLYVILSISLSAIAAFSGSIFGGSRPTS